MFRARPLFPLLIAGLLAACDVATEPRPDAGVPRADSRLDVANTYIVTRLPFRPMGINDAGVIVGTLGIDAVRYEHGVVTTLPRRADVPGAYEASAINASGAIVGRAGAAGLYWPHPASPPVKIEAPGTVIPRAINASGVVVGSVYTFHTRQAFRWTRLGGFEDLAPVGVGNDMALDVDDDGRAVGGTWAQYGAGRARRWGAPGTGGVEAPADARVLLAIGPDGDAYGEDLDGRTRRWPLGGGSHLVSIPSGAFLSDVSRGGRLVGLRDVSWLSTRYHPWTRIGAVTTYLPLPASSGVDSQTRLRVNGCGSIIADAFDGGELRGLLWVRPTCDGGGVELPMQH